MDTTKTEIVPIVKKEPSPKKKEQVGKIKTYAVKSGDTLSEIARKFNVSVAKLKTANGLRNDLIRPGQKLKIP